MAKYFLRISILMLLVTGGACAQCLPGGLAIVVNKANPVESLSMGQLRKLLLGDVRSWQDHKPVSIVARAPSSKVFQCALSTIVRLSVADFQRYVINAEFRGDEAMTIQIVDSDANAAKIVGGSAGAFAVVEANSVPTLGPSVKVIHIEGKALGQPGYPL
jgi:ABC-type phosphate transport system substrate-binding protein